MTVVNTEARLGMANATLPRVNLLPPEIAEQATLKKVQMGLGAGVLGAVGIVGLLFVSATHGVSSAQTSLDQETSRGQSLVAQKAQYANVTAVYSAAAAAQAQLSTAMGQEVRYSQLMHDLSLSIPSTVWLKSLSYTQTPPAAPAGAAPAAATAAGTAAAKPAVATGPTAIGTLTVTGIGFSHDDLALWLESLANQKNYADAFFSSSTESLMGQRKIVTFTSTTNLTSNAYSGRYTKPLGD